MTEAKKSAVRKRSERNKQGPKKTQRRAIVSPMQKAQQAAREIPDGKRKVKAFKLGFYDNERRRVGDVFVINSRNFNPSWMTEVDPRTRVQRTTGTQELKMRMGEIRDQKRAEVTGEILTGRDDVDQSIDDDGDNPLGT